MLETIVMQMAISSGKKVAATIASKVLLNVGACAGSMVVSNQINKHTDKKLISRVEAGEFKSQEEYNDALKKARTAVCIEQATVSGLALGAAAVAFNGAAEIIKK